jgi:hypothetical protein
VFSLWRKPSELRKPRLTHFPENLRLVAENEPRDVKAVQKLMRYANLSTTMNLYLQTSREDCRQAQGKLVEMVHRAALLATAEAAGV